MIIAPKYIYFYNCYKWESFLLPIKWFSPIYMDDVKTKTSSRESLS